MKISMSSKKSKIKKIKVDKIKTRNIKTKPIKTKSVKTKNINTKGFKTIDKKKLALCFGIGGGLLAVVGIVVLLFLLLNPALIVSGRVFEDSTKTTGLSFCKIYKDTNKIGETNGLGEFKLLGLEVGDEITFIHNNYNLNDFEQFDYIVNGTAYLEIIGSLKPTEQEIEAMSGITISFKDNNNNLITSGITAKDINENIIATTSNGKMIIPIEANIRVYFSCYYYNFESMDLTLEDKATTVDHIGEFNLSAKKYLTCTYSLNFEDNTAFVNNAATVVYTYKNTLSNINVLETLNSDSITGQYFIQFTSDNEVMFESMSIYIKDETNNKYWYIENISPSPSNGVVNLSIKSGYMVQANYIPNRKIYLENGGILNCDTNGSFWFIVNGVVPKFYTSAEKTTELKIYDDTDIISNITENTSSLILK